MDFIVYVLILLITGVFVGFLSGLLGVGGGFVMGPVQFWLLLFLGFEPNMAIRIAFGTSLAVIIPTALSGSAGHYIKGAVEIKPAMIIGLSSIITAYIGGVITANTPAYVLSTLFGIVIIFLAVWMLSSQYPHFSRQIKGNTFILIVLGLVTGLLSGILGIGGGTILIPFLIILIGCSVHKAIGTASVVVIFTAMGGVISYIINGINVAGLPTFSIGYINLVNLIILACATVPLAQIGVKISHTLPAEKLKYIYSILIIYIGLRMIGVFSWLHLPI